MRRAILIKGKGQCQQWPDDASSHFAGSAHTEYLTSAVEISTGKNKRLAQLPFTWELRGFSDHVFFVLFRYWSDVAKGDALIWIDHPQTFVQVCHDFLFAVWQGLKYPLALAALLQTLHCPTHCAHCVLFVLLPSDCTLHMFPIYLKLALKLNSIKDRGFKTSDSKLWMTAHFCSDKQHRTKQSCRSKHKRD